mgnify:FL=1
MNPTKLFRKWLDAWWREHHPAGGGSPPTLEEAFTAGLKEEIDEEDAYDVSDSEGPIQVTRGE